MQYKAQLYKSFCICFYDIGLWENFHVYCLNKFVTDMFLRLSLESFDTVLHNARIRFVNNLPLLENNVVMSSHARCDDCLHALFLYRRFFLC